MRENFIVIVKNIKKKWIKNPVVVLNYMDAPPSTHKWVEVRWYICSYVFEEVLFKISSHWYYAFFIVKKNQTEVFHKIILCSVVTKLAIFAFAICHSDNVAFSELDVDHPIIYNPFKQDHFRTFWFYCEQLTEMPLILSIFQD